MQTLSAPTIIPTSGVARLSTEESRLSAGRSIALEGIAVIVRVPNLLRISALVLLLIAILAD